MRFASIGLVLAIAVLLASVYIKGWAAFRLMNRYPSNEYRTSEDYRRLFWIGKITPLAACAAIVALAYCTGLWWVIAPAWLFLGIILWGVIWRIRRTV